LGVRVLSSGAWGWPEGLSGRRYDEFGYLIVGADLEVEDEPTTKKEAVVLIEDSPPPKKFKKGLWI